MTNGDEKEKKRLDRAEPSTKTLLLVLKIEEWPSTTEQELWNHRNGNQRKSKED